MKQSLVSIDAVAGQSKSTIMTAAKLNPIHVFIVGTGRSGTHTAAKLLSAIPECSVLHEVKPRLLEESLAYLYGRADVNGLRLLLKQTRSPEALGGARLSGESNQRLSFVLPILSQVFPDASYLWFIRDGRDSVASFHQRLWYDREEQRKRPGAVPWVRARIKADEVGEMSASEWERLGSFGRCCWYWSFVNRLIKNESQRLKLKIRLCRLESIQDDLPGILDFLGISRDKAPSVIPWADRSSGVPPLSWRYWSQRDLEIFSDFAGKEMDEFYPGWKGELSRPLGMRVAGGINRGLRRLRQSRAYVRSKARQKRNIIARGLGI